MTIEGAEDLLNDKSEAMKDINDWNKEGEEHALVVQRPQFEKVFKGKCGYCANIAIKQLIVMREKQIKKRRMLVVYSNLQNS